MCYKTKLFALLLALVLRSALTAPTKETWADADFANEEAEEEERGLERQLLTTVFGGAAEAGASGLALPALAGFRWREMLLRGLFMIFQMMMRSHQ